MLSVPAVTTPGGTGTAREPPHPRSFNPDLPVTETAYWYACGVGALGTGQGWKLYVPMTVTNAHQLTELVTPLVLEAGLHFKYVKNLETLQWLNAGMCGYSQVGKCFVIYLPAPDEKFLAALKRVLRPFRDQCPAVPCARHFGDRLPLYYRFGSYVGVTLVLAGRTIADDRRSLADAVPNGMTDALAPFVEPASDDDPTVAGFLKRYPVFRAIAQRGKCGVFHAMDLTSDTLREILLKVGYHRGQVHVDGTDGCDLLRRELACYRALDERGLTHLVPTLIDVLDVPRKVILALEYIEGTTLLDRLVVGRLTVDELERAWASIELFHAGGVYLGDAKLANVMVTPEGAVRVLDLEAGGLVGDRAPAVCTFVVRPQREDPREADRAHFLASVLYSYDSSPSSWRDRVVDLRAWRGHESDDPVTAWAIERLGRLLG